MLVTKYQFFCLLLVGKPTGLGAKRLEEEGVSGDEGRAGLALRF